MREVQESITEAMVKPAVPRVWAHVSCGGWVLFELAGGFCLHCEAGPLVPGQYVKPAAAAERAA
jgi:hypothetical protein